MSSTSASAAPGHDRDITLLYLIKQVELAVEKEKRLEKIERLEKPQDESAIRFRFDTRRRTGDGARSVESTHGGTRRGSAIMARVTGIGGFLPWVSGSAPPASAAPAASLALPNVIFHFASAWPVAASYAGRVAWAMIEGSREFIIAPVLSASRHASIRHFSANGSPT